jgi:photosystem II stability/assembly factor-like uncharacterized protein
MRRSAAAGFLALLAVVCVRPVSATGWAVGGNGLVIRSTDAGQNWSASSPASATLNGVHFVSDDVGWAVGNGGIVLKTTDGGANWLQSSPGSVNLNAVFFVDASRGWIVGDAGRVLRTTNGGTSWTTYTPNPAALHGVFFVNPNSGWAVGNGVVLKTTNGGVTWTASAPTTAVLRDVHFVSASAGWAVGSNGVVLKSTNGGSSWTSSSPTTTDLNSVRFASATLGWAVGGSGSIIRTTNGGTSWTEQRPVTGALQSVYFIDDRTGWAAGQNGALLNTVDGGVSWTAAYPASVTLNGVFFASVPASVRATVTTNPPGRAFTVDDVGYSGAQTFQWEPGVPHTIATTSPQSGAPGTQYVWSNWSNGGAISQTVTPDVDVTYTANFTTQYALSMQAGANGTVEPASGWYDAGASVEISATPDPGYGFNGWTGTGSGSFSGWANPADIDMNGPITEIAAFGTDVTVEVQSVPSGLSFVVDGTTYTTTQSFTWAPGSSHSIDAPSPQGTSPDTRQVFSRWSDGGSAAHTVAPVSNIRYTATFKTQYTLSMQAGGGGSVGPASGWLDANSIVAITATPDSGYSFQSWAGTGAGSYSGSSNPKSITISGPIVEQATFVLGTSPAPPATLTLLPNAPNPFAAQTDIRFGLPQESDVTIEVFDVAGRRVFADVARGVPRGWQTYRLDAAGALSLRSGVYFVRVGTARETRTDRIVVIR